MLSSHFVMPVLPALGTKAWYLAQQGSSTAIAIAGEYPKVAMTVAGAGTAYYYRKEIASSLPSSAGIALGLAGVGVIMALESGVLEQMTSRKGKKKRRRIK